jgi:hypothetical protein
MTDLFAVVRRNVIPPGNDRSHGLAQTICNLAFVYQTERAFVWNNADRFLAQPRYKNEGDRLFQGDQLFLALTPSILGMRMSLTMMSGKRNSGLKAVRHDESNRKRVTAGRQDHRRGTSGELYHISISVASTPAKWFDVGTPGPDPKHNIHLMQMPSTAGVQPDFESQW